MGNSSFDKVSFFYDFFEKYVLKDYQGSLDLFDRYLHFDDNIRLIDVGGGTGFFAKEIFKNVIDIVVVDPSNKMLRKIKNDNVYTVQGDGVFLSFKKDTFDLAILVNVLHHIHKKFQKQVLKEVYRILNDSGRIFIIEVFIPDTFTQKLFCFIESIMTGETFHLSEQKLKSYLKDIGFKSIEMKKPSKNSWKYVLIASK